MNDFSLVRVSLCPQDKESGRGFAPFYRAGRIKGGLPCGGRKGVVRSAWGILNPLTEFEMILTTSGSKNAGHIVPGVVSGSFRLPLSAQTGAGRITPGLHDLNVDVQLRGDSEISLAPVGNESGRLFASFGPFQKDICPPCYGSYVQAPSLVQKGR